MIASRYFNSISILNDTTIRKASKDSKKMIAEYRWFEARDDYNHPNAYNLQVGDVTTYDMEYIHGRTLAYTYINESIPVDQFCSIIEFVIRKIFKHRDNSVNTPDYKYREDLNYLYGTKTRDRLLQYGYNLDVNYTLNDVVLPTLNEIINSCYVSIDVTDLSYVHGDMCFSNMIIDDTFQGEDIEEHLYFIDPRGMLPNKNKEITSVGDYKYDIGKLAHSILGNYDLIKADILTADKVGPNSFVMYDETTQYKNIVKEKFLEVAGCKEVWYNIMIHLFLSMIPLHDDCPRHQDAMLANALRLYLEKVNLFKK